MNKLELFTIAGFLLLTGALVTFCPELALAKDFAAGIRDADSKISSIAMVLGPASLLAAAIAFHFSKQLGVTLLTSAIIGILIFATRHGIHSLAFDTFSR